jgi:hypothetical protein
MSLAPQAVEAGARLVSQPALPVVPISLRLARERGETNNNVERVSLEPSTGAQTGKLGEARPSGAGKSGFQGIRRLFTISDKPFQSRHDLRVFVIL